jgi:hypothetical protein
MDDQIRLQMRFESIQTGEILREVSSYRVRQLGLK